MRNRRKKWRRKREKEEKKRIRRRMKNRERKGRRRKKRRRRTRRRRRKSYEYCYRYWPWEADNYHASERRNNKRLLELLSIKWSIILLRSWLLHLNATGCSGHKNPVSHDSDTAYIRWHQGPETIIIIILLNPDRHPHSASNHIKNKPVVSDRQQVYLCYWGTVQRWRAEHHPLHLQLIPLSPLTPGRGRREEHINIILPKQHYQT